MTELSTENAKLVGAVLHLQDDGLSGMQILKTWIERNIQPLAWREHPMYDYRGRNDPRRLHNREVSSSEVKSHMHFVTHVPLDEIFLEVAVEPYHWGKRPKEVSAASLLLCLTFDCSN